jgi:transcriptional regulator with PAS, ATPase and Fis domain
LKSQAARVLTVIQPEETETPTPKNPFEFFRDWNFSAVPHGHPTHGISRIIGASEQITDLRRQVERFAATEESVLICGETGTGKELIAELLHGLSSRRAGPFVAINCAAVPDTLAESEFFGTAKGAYTGAGEARSGLIESACSGTLFLDEFGELSPSLQPKLLRTLDRRTYRRVGSCKEERADVRIIAATNRNLEELIQTGGFRADLFHRINVLNILTPPLREHRNDIPFLVGEVLGMLLAPGTSIKVSAAAMTKLISAPWPGNVRELKNTMRRALALCNDELINEADLMLNTMGTSTPASQPPRSSLEELVDVLNRAKGQLGPVAEELGVSVRTIQRRMKDAGLRLKEFRAL